MTDTALAKPRARPPRPQLRSALDHPAMFPVLSRVRPLASGQLFIDNSVKLAIIGLFLIAFIYALGAWGAFVAPVVAAVVMGLMLGPPMGLLVRFWLPPPLAALVVLVLLASALYLLVLFFAPPFTEWLVRLPELWNEIERHLNQLQFHLRMVEQVEERLAGMASSSGAGSERVAVEGPGFVRALAGLAPPAFGQMVLFFGALYFYLATRDRLRGELISIFPARGAKLRTARIIRDVEANISRYLLTITVINAVLGMATALAMWALGMPSPALWGAMAAILNFIPYVGPFAFIVLLVAVGLVTFENLGAALVAPGIFIILNIIEGQFLTPAVLGRRLTINPFIIVIALGFWMWLWGPVGAFLALPLLIITMITFSHIISGRPRYPAARRTDSLSRTDRTSPEEGLS